MPGLPCTHSRPQVGEAGGASFRYNGRLEPFLMGPYLTSRKPKGVPQPTTDWGVKRNTHSLLTRHVCLSRIQPWTEVTDYTDDRWWHIHLLERLKGVVCASSSRVHRAEEGEPIQTEVTRGTAVALSCTQEDGRAHEASCSTCTEDGIQRQRAIQLGFLKINETDRSFVFDDAPTAHTEHREHRQRRRQRGGQTQRRRGTPDRT